MAAPEPFEDLTLTQTTSGIPIGTLSFTHPDEVDLDRAMLGFTTDGETWTNLEPRPIAEFGSNPYEVDVPLTEGIEWRVVAISAAGEVSA